MQPVASHLFGDEASVAAVIDGAPWPERARTVGARRIPDTEGRRGGKAVNHRADVSRTRPGSASPRRNSRSSPRSAKVYLEAQIDAFRKRTRAEKDAHDFMWGIAGGDSRTHRSASVAGYYLRTAARGRPDQRSGARRQGQGVVRQGRRRQRHPRVRVLSRRADAEGPGRLPAPHGPGNAQIRRRSNPVTFRRWSAARAGDARHRQGHDAGRDAGCRHLCAVEVGAPSTRSQSTASPPAS